MLQAQTPNHAGSREQARELIGALSQPLAGERVAVDFGPLLVPTPSYCDEIVKFEGVEHAHEAHHPTLPRSVTGPPISPSSPG